ncbi:MAG: hypothetical protein RJA07_720 [Bacteroidota bacterium]|jgi:hypothetical protein
MLSRNKIYHKEEVNKDVKKIYIFCEGNREVNYFNFFKGFSSNIDIITIPTENNESAPSKLYQAASTKFGNNIFAFSDEFGDEVWFVIDTDRWNKNGQIDFLREACQKNKNWQVSQSNPSFELWLYFHFHAEKPSQEDIEQAESFKAFVHSKIIGGGGFNSDIHRQLFQKAIVHSENNFEAENNQPKYLSTEVHFVAKSMLPFLKPTFDKLLKL